MAETGPFARFLLLLSLAAVAAVLSHRLIVPVRVPRPHCHLENLFHAWEDAVCLTLWHQILPTRDHLG
jgi:hypothetical protein